MTAVGGKDGLWHGRLANGTGCMENKKHTEALIWTCISMDFFPCNSNIANTAHKQIMLQLATCTESCSRRNLAVLGQMEKPDVTAKGCEEGGF